MTATQIIILVTAMIVLTCTFLSICDMNRHTNHMIRLAILILAGAEFAILVGPLFGIIQSSVMLGILNVGIAMMTVCDRMRCRYQLSGGRHAFTSKG